jgi:hypothetical protein
LKDAWLSPDRLPASRPSTLMSSSMLSQWMPCPFPINFQFSFSACVACKSLGNHAKGAEIVLPSLKSTLSVSSVIITRSAFGTAISTAEIVIPSLHEPRMIFFDHFLNAADFHPAETAAAAKHYRLKPEFSYFIVPLDVTVSVHLYRPRKRKTDMIQSSEQSA